MNRKELIDTVSELGEMTKKDAGKAIDLVFDCVANALENGDNVKLVGFGTFAVKERAERNGRNPQTQETMIIPARKAVTFKPAKDLKERVDK